MLIDKQDKNNLKQCIITTKAEIKIMMMIQTHYRKLNYANNVKDGFTKNKCENAK